MIFIMLPPLDIPLLRTFVTLVEEGSLTRTARRLHRTQPAISLQLARLEQAASKALFHPNRRQLMLTPAGRTMLGYARSILRLHDEAQGRLTARPAAGRVMLGCPDLYAVFLLPKILAGFRQSQPDVEVQVRCALSRPLIEELSDGIVDIALVTEMPEVAPRLGHKTPLRQEPLVWMGARDGQAHREHPLPLAMLPEGNLYRDYAIDALERAGRAWRIAGTSESISGLHAIAQSGNAVTVLSGSVVLPGMRELGPAEDLPPLRGVTLALWQRSPGVLPAADLLAEHIAAIIQADGV